ncbi:hypothetical protein CALCODRAFT_435231, partial [Calocera cornea HHB12733]
GHTIVPATVPAGTLMYHGTNGEWGPDPPEGSEWLTLDEDHALYFSSQDGRLFTYTATRDLRLLYFDGVSAAVMPTGTQDTQDVIIYGNVSEFHWSPFIRICQLCDWAKKHNVDGFVRMEFDFEIMYCEFSDGLELVSNLDVVSCASDPPPGWVGSQRPPFLLAYETLASGNWHNAAPIPGVQVDYAGLISFYDPRYESLVPLRREAGGRTQHRLLNISASDVKLFYDDLDDVLTRAPGTRSTLDWRGLMRHIVAQFSDRLQYLQHLLHARDGPSTPIETEPHDPTSLIYDIRQQVLTMLAPYISRGSFAALPGGALDDAWFAQTLRRCSASHTAHITTARLTPQERVLQSAVEETMHEICRTLLVIWRTAYTAEAVTSSDQQVRLIREWKSEMDRLVAWLDWAVWQSCHPACGDDYVCSLPQWPFDGISNGTESETAPRCISRLHWQPQRRWNPPLRGSSFKTCLP